MNRKVRIDPLARQDLVGQKKWYNKKKKGLGEVFYRTVKKKIELIATNPYQFQVRYKNIRMVPLIQFPFCIHYYYESEEDHLVIIAVLHTSRDPEIWDQRS